jgi:ADP-ribose pyrophosphatase YjhB (NUDIX family)
MGYWAMSKQDNYHFKTVHWGDDRSTEVVFEPISTLPPKELISSCFVFALYEGNKVIMTKPKRGWGLPGGHREGDETAEECVQREAAEEASITLKDVQLGRWVAKKKFDSPFNQHYPDLAYQLLFVANVDSLNDFSSEFETSERAIVPLSRIKDLHHNFDNFEAVLT